MTPQLDSRTPPLDSRIAPLDVPETDGSARGRGPAGAGAEDGTGQATKAAWRRARRFLYPVVLVALTIVVFRDGFHQEFLTLDDGHYITENPLVHGLTWDRVREAFSGFHVLNYNPLHLVSYMVDYELWGLDPAGFFLTNLLLHLAAGILCYFLVLGWSRSAEAAFFVAAVFLVHPTRVESVAWLSERKDVLSAFLGLGSILLYSRYLAVGPADGAAGGSRRAIGSIAGSWLLFVLAILAKSQLVILPLVFLILDLLRFRPLRKAIVEKIPFFLPSAALSAATLFAHGDVGQEGVKFPDSILVPLAALPRYILQAAAPIGLAPYYDQEFEAFASPAWIAAGALTGALLVWLAWRSFRGDRVVFAGVACFLAFLLPVIGLVTIHIFLADRYLYLSIIGLAVLAARGFAALQCPPTWRRSGAVLAVACLAVLTARYVPCFHDSASVWARVLEVCPESSRAHTNLGFIFLQAGRLEDAAAHYDADLARPPVYKSSVLGKALVHEKEGDREGASKMYALALNRWPRCPQVRVQHAESLQRGGEPRKGIETLLGLEPAFATGRVFLKVAELERILGRGEAELSALREAARRSPLDPAAWFYLSRAEEEKGDLASARSALQRAASLAPGFPGLEEAARRLATGPAAFLSPPATPPAASR